MACRPSDENLASIRDVQKFDMLTSITLFEYIYSSHNDTAIVTMQQMLVLSSENHALFSLLILLLSTS